MSQQGRGLSMVASMAAVLRLAAEWPKSTIVFLALVANVFTLLNPGFFNHDEWQRLDHIRADGIASYIAQYGVLKAGPDFGFPVRPIGFLQQGLSALFMQDAPFVAHLMDVVLHTACCLALWWLLQASPMRGRRATIAAMVFAVSPLAVFSTAWVGASFDRWYVLFALVAGGGLTRIAYRGLTARNVVLLMAGSIGAVLGKETAVMLPVALLLGAIVLTTLGGAARRPGPLIAALALASLPVLAYLAVRLPALQASFGGHPGVDAYDPGKGSIVDNALLYFAQPFLLPAVELVSAVFIPRWMWCVAASLHGLLVVALVRRSGPSGGVLYLAGYFVFLVPVLPLPNIGAHYLYGSGVVFAIGMSLLLPPAHQLGAWRGKVGVALFAGLLAIGVAHTLWIGRAMQQAGACQVALLDSLDAQIASATSRGKTSIQVNPDPGAPGYVAVRSTFGRTPYGSVRVQDGSDPSRDPTVLPLRMDTRCRVTSH